MFCSFDRKMVLLLTFFSTAHPLLGLSYLKEPEKESERSVEAEGDEEEVFERLGLALSRAHARAWQEQFGRRGKGTGKRGVNKTQGIQVNKEVGAKDTKRTEESAKSKERRQGRAYWGLSKIYGQATKTKDHFSKELSGLGGLLKGVGDLFGSSDDYDEDEVFYIDFSLKLRNFLLNSGYIRLHHHRLRLQ